MRSLAHSALALALSVLAALLGIGPAELVTPARADEGPRACQLRSRRARAAPSQRGGRRRSRRARRPRLTRAQREQIRRWHARPSGAAVRTWARLDPPPLVFHPLRQREHVALVPASPEGGFEADDLALAQSALASRDGSTADIHPRLLELVYRAVRHFQVPYVHVVSGYRPGRPTSRHAQGRALDMVLPGVSDRRLAAFLRPQGFVGVGIYPVSGFVHLDVRARSYFWSDGSGPDEANRERPILHTLTSRFDAAARRRGEAPVPDLELPDATDEEVEEESAAAEEVDSPAPSTGGGTPMIGTAPEPRTAL